MMMIKDNTATDGRPLTYLLHGFNVFDGGKQTTEKIRPYLLKHSTVKSIKYGWFGLLSVMLRNKYVAKRIVEDQQKQKRTGQHEFFGVGHSNGCAILVEAARRGARFDALLLINPALKIDTTFPANIKRVIVIYTKHDKPTATARLLEKLPVLGLAVPNAWGAMGAQGYRGHIDVRVLNVDLSSYLTGHSDIFTADNMRLFGDSICHSLYKNNMIETI